jgi:Tol biopolymer transport system component
VAQARSRFQNIYVILKSLSAQLLIPLLCLVLWTQISCTWLDHPTNRALQRELIEQSKHGLALARYRVQPLSEIEVCFFDGSRKRLKNTCCSLANNPTISRNRLVAVDTTSTLPDPLRLGVPNFLQALQSYGGQVVVADTETKVLARSETRIWPAEVFLSPDQKRFAFISVLQGGQQADSGLYVAGFGKAQVWRLMSVRPATPHDGFQAQTTVDWSPDGNSLVCSIDGAVLVVDSHTGKSRKLADGSAPLWSPSGDQISYVTLDWEPALLNLSGGESKRIDPGKKTSTPLEWSPDGKYLLIAEGTGSHVWYGCLWVYRVSDGAFVPIPNYGVGGPRAHWIQL